MTFPQNDNKLNYAIDVSQVTGLVLSFFTNISATAAIWYQFWSVTSIITTLSHLFLYDNQAT